MQNFKKENKIDRQTKEREEDFSWKITNKKKSFEIMKKLHKLLPR
jgi:hypothetical protein